MDEDNKRLEELGEYFDHILDAVSPSIKLDNEQRRAIIADDDAALIIAGAGTGKTTTMIAKVKYLVDVLKVDPKRILVMSFARKNVVELRDRINVDLNIPADVSTFHSLGYKYLRSLYARNNRKCYVVDDNDKEKIFADFFSEEIYTSKECMKGFVETFDPRTVGETWLFGKFFKENYDQFNNFDDYFEFYKTEQMNAWGDISLVLEGIAEERSNADSPKSLRGEYVKSKGEAMIANFLFKHGIDYEYERIYEEIMPDEKTYRPDFTLNLGGEKVYIEYFGLSAEGVIYDKTYERIRKIKKDYHRAHHTRFIGLEYDDEYKYIDVLRQKLEGMGFAIKPKNEGELADAVLDQNKLAELFKVERLFIGVVDAIKSSSDRVDFDKVVQNYINHGFETEFDFDKSLAMRQYKYVRRFLSYYVNRLVNSDPSVVGLDYADMIFFAKKYIEELSKERFNYEYVIIDEYQDISFDRYELTIKTLARNHAKLVAIGDDWQSIYAFTGSRIEYTYNFQKMFPGAKLYRIQHTYRTVQDLADISGDFIMRNKNQIEKHLVSNRNLDNPIRIAYFGGDTKEEQMHNEIEVLKDEILKVHKNDPNGSIFVLARRNKDLKYMYSLEDVGFIDGLETKASIRGHEDFSFDAMTIHKSKGLTADYVFVIGLNKSFPHESYGEFWLKDLFTHKPEHEGIEFAEERRVFYVALTRTKNQVTLLCNRSSDGRSKFLIEIMDMIN